MAIDPPYPSEPVPSMCGHTHKGDSRMRNDMSRSTQTAWIVCTIMLIAIGVMLYVGTRPDPNDPWAECKQLFGYDSACQAEIAARNLRSM